MQTSQIKEKLVQMLDVVNSIEKVEMELRSILGPINQYEVQESIVKAKPRGRGTRLDTGVARAKKGWQTRANGTYSRANIKQAITKIWYYTKENKTFFNPKEITCLIGIEAGQLAQLWRKISQELGLVNRLVLKRVSDHKGQYQYTLTDEAAAKIEKLIA
jgi:hypothetical protein